MRPPNPPADWRRGVWLNRYCRRASAVELERKTDLRAGREPNTLEREHGLAAVREPPNRERDVTRAEIERERGRPGPGRHGGDSRADLGTAPQGAETFTLERGRGFRTSGETRPAESGAGARLKANAGRRGLEVQVS